MRPCDRYERNLARSEATIGRQDSLTSSEDWLCPLCVVTRRYRKQSLPAGLAKGPNEPTLSSTMRPTVADIGLTRFRRPHSESGRPARHTQGLDLTKTDIRHYRALKPYQPMGLCGSHPNRKCPNSDGARMHAFPASQFLACFRAKLRRLRATAQRSQ
jgi:hypothetical protein